MLVRTRRAAGRSTAATQPVSFCVQLDTKSPRWERIRLDRSCAARLPAWLSLRGRLPGPGGPTSLPRSGQSARSSLRWGSRCDRAKVRQAHQRGARTRASAAGGETSDRPEREQLAQAYAVQVVLTQRRAEGAEVNQYGDKLPPPVWRLTAIVVNHGSYTISRIEAQFCIGNSMTSPHRFERMPSFNSLPTELRSGEQPTPEIPLRGVLTPFDRSIRFETDDIHEKHLVSPYPVVRWVDHWGTWWEHKRGVVRPIADAEPWVP
jgi:hypothetical protein